MILKIENFKEKRLLVARLIISEQLEPTDKNIIDTWRIISFSDVNELDADLLKWIKGYVNSNNIKSCDKQLEKVRCKGLINLKTKCKQIGYGAKLVRQPKNALATYNIFTKGMKYSGNYRSLCRRIGRLPKIKSEKEIKTNVK